MKSMFYCSGCGCHMLSYESVKDSRCSWCRIEQEARSRQKPSPVPAPAAADEAFTKAAQEAVDELATSLGPRYFGWPSRVHDHQSTHLAGNWKFQI